ncbi:MAG: TlpA family protein disulfide reductase [Betaproteobacteria bacterium]|nr:TlpA family protein disulfide reductase [Betaproteobacteria bacterium]
MSKVICAARRRFAGSLALGLVAAAGGLVPVAARAADAFRFTPYPKPRPLPAVSFLDGQGKPSSLAAFRGKVVLLNIWATWCPPCVQEMPTLNKLQQLLGGKEFEVVPLSVDKGGVFAVHSFYQDNFIDHLPIYVDPTTKVLDSLNILGTPTTILIDKQGREVARTLGPQDWDQPSMIQQLRHYMAQPAGVGAERRV